MLCAVVLIGVSDIGVATIGNKKALFVTLVDRIPRFEAPNSIDLRIAQISRYGEFCVHRPDR